MNDTAVMAFVLGIAMGIFLFIMITSASGNSTVFYKNGQIDCLNNQIYYELQRQGDGTTEWIYVPEGVK